MVRDGLTCLLILVGLGLVKAHIHMIRLLVVALAGLAGLYLVHRLAQDFNKIQNSWGMGPFGNIGSNLGNLGNLFRWKRTTKEDWLIEKFPNDTQVMATLVDHDPIGCARKYVCYISAKSPKKLTTSQKNVLGILKTFEWLDSDGEWGKAKEIGQKTGRRGGCEAAYLKCGYTGAQLNRFITMFDLP